MISDTGLRGVCQFQIFYVIVGRGEGVRQFLIWADKEGAGIWNPQSLADIICEQPLRPLAPVGSHMCATGQIINFLALLDMNKS